MRTESKKSYSVGFFVSETELRRIVDTVTTQFEKGPCSTVPSTAVEITFRNGSISETDKLDDVFQLENGGSGTIEKLSIRMRPGDGETERCAAEITFAKPEDEADKSVKYVLQGSDRDWVFVTSSLLEERLSRVKRLHVGGFIFSRKFFPLLMMFAFLPLVMAGTVMQQNALGREKHIFADSVNAEWRRGAFKDPIQAMVRIEEIRAKAQPQLSRWFTTMPFLGVTAVMLVLVAGAKARPGHTFYWGEALNAYDRHAKIANYIGGVLILGIVISVIGEVVANWFTGG